MTTSRKPMSGRGQDNKISSLDKYNKDSKSKQVGTFMRTFARTKTSQFITSWDDPNFLLVVNNYIQALADTTGAVDSLTVAQANMLNWLDIVWELYFTNSNLKDLVAADEASWKLYFCAYLQIKAELQIQYNVRTLLPAFTESDVVPGSGTAISFFSQSSYDIFLASMSQYPAPKGVNELVTLFCSWIIQISAEYERFSLRIPPGYITPFSTSYDLEDLEAMRDLLRVNLGGFKTHAKKYGLGTSTWSDPVSPKIVKFDDPNVIAYLNHVHFKFYDNQPAQQEVTPDGAFAGANLTTDYTLVEYFFKDSPNESPIHVLAPWFGTYNATNNPYGGIIKTRAAPTTEYKVNALTCSQHATGMTTVGLTDKNAHVYLAHTKAYDDDEDAVFKVSNNGTNFTAAQAVGGAWKMASDYNLLMGSGRGATETNNDLLNYLGKLIT